YRRTHGTVISTSKGHSRVIVESATFNALFAAEPIEESPESLSEFSVPLLPNSLVLSFLVSADEDHVQEARPVRAAHEGCFDVGGSARARDEVDHAREPFAGLGESGLIVF